MFTADDDEPEWMIEYAKKERTQALTQKWRELEERLARIRKEEERRMKLAQNPHRPSKKQVYSYPIYSAVIKC